MQRPKMERPGTPEAFKAVFSSLLVRSETLTALDQAGDIDSILDFAEQVALLAVRTHLATTEETEMLKSLIKKACAVLPDIQIGQEALASELSYDPDCEAQAAQAQSRAKRAQSVLGSLRMFSPLPQDGFIERRSVRLSPQTMLIYYRPETSALNKEVSWLLKRQTQLNMKLLWGRRTEPPETALLEQELAEIHSRVAETEHDLEACQQRSIQSLERDILAAQQNAQRAALQASTIAHECRLGKAMAYEQADADKDLARANARLESLQELLRLSKEGGDPPGRPSTPRR